MAVTLSTTLMEGGLSPYRLARSSALFRSLLKRAMTEVCRDAERSLKTHWLQRGGTYRRTKANKWRWVKNPYEFLRVGYGTLRRSWRVKEVRATAHNVIGVLASDSPYARIHELGGQTGPRAHRFYLRPRPYIKPMINDRREKWARMLGRSIRQAL